MYRLLSACVFVADLLATDLQPRRSPWHTQCYRRHHHAGARPGEQDDRSARRSWCRRQAASRGPHRSIHPLGAASGRSRTSADGPLLHQSESIQPFLPVLLHFELGDAYWTQKWAQSLHLQVIPSDEGGAVAVNWMRLLEHFGQDFVWVALTGSCLISSIIGDPLFLFSSGPLQLFGQFPAGVSNSALGPSPFPPSRAHPLRRQA